MRNPILLLFQALLNLPENPSSIIKRCVLFGQSLDKKGVLLQLCNKWRTNHMSYPKHVIWNGILAKPVGSLMRIISSSIFKHACFKVIFVVVHLSHTNFNKNIQYILQQDTINLLPFTFLVNLMHKYWSIHLKLETELVNKLDALWAYQWDHDICDFSINLTVDLRLRLSKKEYQS